MINRTSYEEYISTVRDYYISHCNEFKFLNSLLGILANNILYCENEAQVKETDSLEVSQNDSSGTVSSSSSSNYQKETLKMTDEWSNLYLEISRKTSVV